MVRQSFQELTELHKPKISDELAKLLSKGASKHSLPEDSINEKPHTKQEIHRIPDLLEETQPSIFLATMGSLFDITTITIPFPEQDPV